MKKAVTCKLLNRPSRADYEENTSNKGCR